MPKKLKDFKVGDTVREQGPNGPGRSGKIFAINATSSTGNYTTVRIYVRWEDGQIEHFEIEDRSPTDLQKFLRNIA